MEFLKVCLYSHKSLEDMNHERNFDSADPTQQVSEGRQDSISSWND